jgi:integrase
LHEAGYDSAVIELQLAHTDTNTVRAIYNRSARLAERKELMQAWADLCVQMAAEARQ